MRFSFFTAMAAFAAMAVEGAMIEPVASAFDASFDPIDFSQTYADQTISLAQVSTMIKEMPEHDRDVLG